ncbi:hypothetical protein H0H87_008102 [Tephrocybe sp. NHM501043]|nr:hypothetical protein H0H87_008102 [Tephrocybe sp. NHM501043]
MLCHGRLYTNTTTPISNPDTRQLTYPNTDDSSRDSGMLVMRVRTCWGPAMCVHTIRVFSWLNNTTHATWSRLSPQIVQHIAKAAIGYKQGGWRRTLLSLGLVCKAWSHVVDVYFMSLGIRYDCDRTTISRVARSLYARPERGVLIRALSVDDYSPVPSARRYQFTDDQWQDLIAILGLNESQLLPVDMEKLVQTLIANWPSLRELKLAGWLTSDDPDAKPPLLPPLSCSLSKLELSCGSLNWCSTEVFLDGVSNLDFTSFLNAVASTLENLHVESCEFSRVSEDEEFAIDAVMPKLAALVNLSAEGPGLATCLALSRKAIARPQHGALVEVKLMPGKSDLHLKDIFPAMSVTGWKSITVIFSESPNAPALIQSILEAATNCGICIVLEVVTKNHSSQTFEVIGMN